MKKYLFTACAAILALALTACGGGGMMGLEVEDESSAQLTAEKADDGDFVLSGTLVVEEGNLISIESALEEGEITLGFIENAEEQDISMDMDEILSEEAVWEGSVVVGESFTIELQPGTYSIRVVAVGKVTGTVDINVVEETGDDSGDWMKADSAKEAGTAAGLDTFVVPEGVKISLGTVEPESYRYMDGIAEASIPVGVVQMFIRKGNAELEEGDISFDSTEYAHEWTQEVEDGEVTCYGNREGEATKTIWAQGEYSYVLLAYGAGGDDDYGLPAEDVVLLVNGIS